MILTQPRIHESFAVSANGWPRQPYNRDMAISRVRPARDSDQNALAQMRALLWPDAEVEQHLKELDAIFGHPMTGTLPMAILVSEDENGTLIGFLEVGLRSHADGCSPARPVGFVEGWFVQEASRGQGVGKELMRSAEDWAREYELHAEKEPDPDQNAFLKGRAQKYRTDPVYRW